MTGGRSVVRHRDRRAERGERGATFVEYALFVGVFVMIAMAAVGALNQGARTYYSSSSTRVGQPPNRVTIPPGSTRVTLAPSTSIVGGD